MSMPLLPKSFTASAVLTAPSSRLAKTSATCSSTASVDFMLPSAFLTETPKASNTCAPSPIPVLASVMFWDRPLMPFCKVSRLTSDSCAAKRKVDSASTEMPIFCESLFR